MAKSLTCKHGIRQHCKKVAYQIFTPIAIFLVVYSIHTDGWPFTWHWLKFFAINISLLVALAKRAKWM